MKINGTISNKTSQITIVASIDWWKEFTVSYVPESIFNIWCTSKPTREEMLSGMAPSAELFIGDYQCSTDFVKNAIEILSKDEKLSGTLMLSRDFLQNIFDEHKDSDSDEWKFFVDWCRSQSHGFD